MKLIATVQTKSMVCLCVKTHFPSLLYVCLFLKKKKKVIVPHYLRESVLCVI